MNAFSKNILFFNKCCFLKKYDCKITSDDTESILDIIFDLSGDNSLSKKYEETKYIKLAIMLANDDDTILII